MQLNARSLAARPGRAAAGAPALLMPASARTSIRRRLATPESDDLWVPPTSARDVRPKAVPGFNQASIKVRWRRWRGGGRRGARGAARSARARQRLGAARVFARPTTSRACTPPQVVGVGGGGSNAVNRMKQANLQGVEFWVANTDAQARGGARLRRCGLSPGAPDLLAARPRAAAAAAASSAHACTERVPAPRPPRPALQALAASPVAPNNRIQIGGQLTRGLGAGGNPEVGLVRRCAPAWGMRARAACAAV